MRKILFCFVKYEIWSSRKHGTQVSDFSLFLNDAKNFLGYIDILNKKKCWWKNN